LLFLSELNKKYAHFLIKMVSSKLNIKSYEEGEMNLIKRILQLTPDTKSIAWAILWGICFSLSLSIIKFLSSHLSSITLLFVRLCFGLIFFYPFIFKTGIKNLKTQNFPLHFLRATLISTAMFCTYYSYTHLPLTVATSIGFTSPLITVALSVLFFKERITFWQWITLIGGYIGVLIIVQPKVILFNNAIWVAFLGNGIASCGILLSKRLSKTESTLQMMAYTLGVSFILIGVLFLKRAEWPELSDLPWLSLAGALGIFSQFCYLQALKEGKPSLIAPFEYLRLVFMIPLGFFIFQEIPRFSMLLGALVIITTTYLLTTKNNQTFSSS
jgi:drug/metabolite transporter (DMT)-like permease